MGWVHRRRDLGGVIFIHLRDRDGVTQLVFDEGIERGSAQARAGARLRICDRCRRHGRRCAAPDTVNPNIATGEVEVVVGSSGF